MANRWIRATLEYWDYINWFEIEQTVQDKLVQLSVLKYLMKEGGFNVQILDGTIWLPNWLQHHIIFTQRHPQLAKHWEGVCSGFTIKGAVGNLEEREDLALNLNKYNFQIPPPPSPLLSCPASKVPPKKIVNDDGNIYFILFYLYFTLDGCKGMRVCGCVRMCVSR